MEKFRISDIRTLLAADLQMFLDETRGHLGLLVARSPHARESLNEVTRYAHTLKGLAATFEAWGLSNWGADLERLFEVAGTFLDCDPDEADQIFRFVMRHMEAWSVMNTFTLAEEFEPAWDYYQGLRAMMEQRWPDYLESVVTSLPGPTAPTKAAAPIKSTAPLAQEALPSEAAEASREERAKPRATVVNLAPPPLLHRPNDMAAPVAPPATGADANRTQSPSVPARPVPLALHAPELRRASKKSPSGTTEPAKAVTTPSTSVPPQVSAPPPILHVASPKSARKKPKQSAPTQPDAAHLGKERLVPTASTPATVPVAPTARPSSNSGPVGPRPVPAADNFLSATDAGLLEMVGQEIENYLGELTLTLKALVANLADRELWEVTRRLFHTIKGTAATFHLDAVSVPAKAAEARCIVAIEDAQARGFDTFEICLDRAVAVAAALNVAFAREAIDLALAEAKARSAPPSADGPSESSPDAEMAGFFIRDARDQIEAIEQAILRWEKGENQTDQVWAAQRGFHTLKGAANSIGLTRVARSIHEAEGFLEGVAAGGGQGSPALFSFLLGAVDQLRGYARQLSENPAARWAHDWSAALGALGPAPAPGGREPAVEGAPTITVMQPQPSTGFDPQDEESHTLRIDASRLHQLMNLIGEVVIDRSRLEKKIERLTRLHRELSERNAALTASVQSFQQQFEFNLLQDSAAGGRADQPGSGRFVAPGKSGPAENEFSELEFDRYDQFSILARSLIEIAHDVEEVGGDMSDCLDSFSVENARFRETSRYLQDSVASLSLLPISTLFPRLQRAFRDAVRVERKEADLDFEGGAALLDKVVIDRIFVPLMHLLRNAVAHGIEDPASRALLKKPLCGRVCVSTTQLSNQIVIRISDDGSGVRVEAVRQRAIEKGWLSADAPALTPEQVVHYIFQPGFSTASKLTSVSGRGMGLDVVRKEIEGLNGSVELHFKPGVGSTWTIRLPLTLSISEAILADSGGVTFAFPINFIESGLIIETSALREEDGRTVCAVGDTHLSVAGLSQLLALPGDANSSNGLIISAGDRRGIITVDRVLRRQEIVVKKLDSIFARHPLLNGATLDAEGRVIPILNLPALLKFSENASNSRTQQEYRGEAAEDSQRLRVLVVDDSLSVRKVQERLLTDLGCQVTAASDGLSALERLREGRFDLIFTDLEMPRVNGYELIAEIRSNPAWASLPVVVISSRGADKYITKAMNLGATSFLSKPFTQEQLQQVLSFYVGWNSPDFVRSAVSPTVQEAA